MIQYDTVSHFVLLSVLGAIAYRLAWCKSIDELITYESARHIALGVVVGVLYHQLHSEYNFPNSVMAFVAGWMGVDFFESLLNIIANRKKSTKKNR